MHFIGIPSQRNRKMHRWTRLCRCISQDASFLDASSWTHLCPDASMPDASCVQLKTCTYQSDCTVRICINALWYWWNRFTTVEHRRIWHKWIWLDASIQMHAVRSVWLEVQLHASKRDASSEIHLHRRVHRCIFRFRYERLELIVNLKIYFFDSQLSLLKCFFSDNILNFNNVTNTNKTWHEKI